MKELGKIEMLDQVLDLQGTLLEIQQRQSELMAELDRMKEENRTLKAELLSVGELEFNGRVYMRHTPGRVGAELFCQVCFDKDRKLIRVQTTEDGQYWRCLACQTTVRQH